MTLVLTSGFLDRTPMGPRRQRAERRTRGRLRELCDEVLASYRAARGKDVVSDEDRREAKALLRRVTPKAPTGR